VKKANASLLILVAGLAFTLGPASANLIANPGFETLEIVGTPPTSFGDWGVDPATIVTAENGITPHGGSRMLRFDGTEAFGGNGAFADVATIIGMSAFAADITAGGATLNALAWFNRIEGDGQTDTAFRVIIRAFSAS